MRTVRPGGYGAQSIEAVYLKKGLMSDAFDIEKMLSERPAEPAPRQGLLRTGEVLGAWRVAAFLGRGRTSEVYRVINVRIGGDGALKILADASAGLRERFLVERELIGSLSIPALPRFFGEGEAKGRPYYVMEYLQPLSLPLGAKNAATLVTSLARSVAALHASGFLHRDLKPANVLLRRNGEPVIIDLGLVKRIGGGGDHGAPSPLSLVEGKPLGVGTLDFAAPEQLLKAEATEASDVFALGKTLKACCGRDTPKAVREVIRRATAEDPEDRYGSADEFADALERAARGGAFTPAVRLAFAASSCAAVAAAAIAVAVARTATPGPAQTGAPVQPTAPVHAQYGGTSAPAAAAAPAETLTQLPGEDDESHFKRLLKAALDGNAQAAADVAEAYYHGRGAETNREEAVEWYRIAADRGHVGAEATLGVCKLHGIGCEKDEGEAAALFLDAAKKGNLGAMANLAYCFRHGFGVDRDPEVAFRWAMMAAERGNAVAQTFVGECYHDGKGVPQDKRRGDDWLTRAARQGNERAQMLLRTR